MLVKMSKSSVASAINSRRSKKVTVKTTATVKLVEDTVKIVKNPSPRKPDSRICGYNFVDKDICGLPEYHHGPHQTVEKSEVPIKVVRRTETNCPMVAKFDTKIAGSLTDIIFAWWLLGNPVSTPLEISLDIYSKGLKFENEINSFPAVHSLVFLGYMETIEWTAANRISRCNKYKLTKEGIKIAETISQKTGTNQIVVQNEKTNTKESTESDCDLCEGTGFNEDNGESCKKCKGTGVIKTKVSNSLPEKVRQPEIVMSTTMVECINCDGTGVAGETICPICKGTGEREGKVEPKKIQVKVKPILATPIVYNKLIDKGIPKDVVYIGRPSKYGNPYKLTTNTYAERQTVIEKFRKYAENRLQKEPNWLDELKGKSVVCFCAPKLCHGDVLIELANKEQKVIQLSKEPIDCKYCKGTGMSTITTDGMCRRCKGTGESK